MSMVVEPPNCQKWLKNKAKFDNDFSKCYTVFRTSIAFLKIMKTYQAEEMANSFLKHHGLYDWKFRWLKNVKSFWRAGQ